MLHRSNNRLMRKVQVGQREGRDAFTRWCSFFVAKPLNRQPKRETELISATLSARKRPAYGGRAAPREKKPHASPRKSRPNDRPSAVRLIVELVRREGPDLTARQLGVMLTCYTEAEPQTVRGLAAQLEVSKPAITRALDRLSEFELVRRKTDPMDRRSVLIQRTSSGAAYVRSLASRDA